MDDGRVLMSISLHRTFRTFSTSPPTIASLPTSSSQDFTISYVEEGNRSTSLAQEVYSCGLCWIGHVTIQLVLTGIHHMSPRIVVACMFNFLIVPLPSSITNELVFRTHDLGSTNQSKRDLHGSVPACV
jgi:hypothetical protein